MVVNADSSTTSLMPGGVFAADRMGAVEVQLNVQAVMAEENRGGCGRLAVPADEGERIRRRGAGAVGQGDRKRAAVDGVAGGVAMAAGEQGNGLVQERARVGDDAGPADGIEGVAGGGAVGGVDGVGAIEGVVETAPAGVGGVERVAGVHHGHDELRAGDAGDLVIGVGCGNLKRRGRGHEVADAREKVFVVIAGEGGGGIGRVPSVDLGLKIIAAGEQGAVARGELGDELAEGRPERLGGDAGAGQDLAGGELGEDRGDA
jgi:hypothetical protein